MPRLRFLQYCWDMIVAPQIGYSFSSPHTIAYSIEAVQEANLATRFNPLFWQCACLSVNSGSSNTDFDTNDSELLGDEEEGQNFDENAEETNPENKPKSPPPNYGKIARAVSDAQRQGANIALPDINLAERDFIPDIETNSIVYSLKAVTSVNDDLIDRIAQYRPYASLEDFLQKVAPTNVQMISMIKGGCFDSLYHGKPRHYIMGKYLDLYADSKVTRKEKLTLANYEKALAQGIIPDNFQLEKRMLFYKKWIDANELNAQDKCYHIQSEASVVFFKDYFEDNLVLGKNYDATAQGYSVKASALKKILDAYIDPLKQWLSSEDAVETFYSAEHEACKEEMKQKYCLGSVSRWEMSSLHFYCHPHELANVNQVYYRIRPFESLPEELKPTGTKLNKKTGAYIPVYDVCAICGTVINADNNKHIVTILTNFNEVVDVKFYKGQYIFYNKAISAMKDGKKETVEKSWFERGNLLLISGVRRENSFLPKTNWEQGFKHSVQLIQGITQMGTLTLKEDREDAQ